MAVGRRVAHFRKQKRPRVSTQKLADECTALGHPLDRSTIAKLELGHRRTVSQAEVLILARALQVPPPLLLFPVGEPGPVEVVPGCEVDPWSAAKWYGGDPPPWPQDSWVIAIFREHDVHVDEWQRARRDAEAAREKANEPGQSLETAEELLKEAQVAEMWARRSAAFLAMVRGGMQRDGLVPPELPPALQLQVDERSGNVQ
jgi:transcriptional regulator with XRE-family HTH domain